MASKRIEYIDALRGLCIFWVVWYHSSHPEWVEYPFRMPTLFFISGIFYKHYPGKVFWKKKVNQYIVPFAFFYLLYYVFLLVINFCKYHSVPSEVYLSFFDFAHMYSGFDGYSVNYPLWFMVALLVLQLITYLITSLTHSHVVLLTISAVLTIVGSCFLFDIKMPLFIGKALTFYIYYVFGFVIGKKYITFLESGNIDKMKFTLCTAFFFVFVFINIAMFDSPVGTFCQYMQFLTLPFILLWIFKKISNVVSMMRVLLFLGSNSLIIFGLHDMYLSLFRIVFGRFINVDNVFVGMFMVLCTLLLCVPTINIMQRYIPCVVGKKPLLLISK